MKDHQVVENLLRQIVEEAHKRNAVKVTKVRLALGEVLGFDADVIRQEYGKLSRGTIAEGSQLEIRWVIAGRDIYIENIEIEPK